MAADTGIKTFISSAINADDGEEGNDRSTTIDDVDVTFMLPDINQVVLATALIENATSDVQAGAALINIFFGLIKPDEVAVNIDGDEIDEDDEDEYDGPVYRDYTARKLQAKMMNPRDRFGIVVISEIMRWLLEEWSDRPTRPSSPSSVSRKQPGKASPARQRGEGSTRGTTRASARGARS